MRRSSTSTIHAGVVTAYTLLALTYLTAPWCGW